MQTQETLESTVDYVTSRFIEPEAFSEATGLSLEQILDNYTVQVGDHWLVPRFMLFEAIAQQDDEIAAEYENASTVEQTIDPNWDNTSSAIDLPLVIKSEAPPSVAESPEEDPLEEIINRSRWYARYPLANPATRLLARSIDLFLFGLVMSVISAGVYVGLLNDEPKMPSAIIFMGMTLLIVPLAMLLESLCFGLTKTTCGKAICGVRVLQASGESYSGRSYLARNFHIWVQGLAIALLPITLITLLVQYNRTRKRLPTTYDSADWTRVELKSALTRNK